MIVLVKPITGTMEVREQNLDASGYIRNSAHVYGQYDSVWNPLALDDQYRLRIAMESVAHTLSGTDHTGQLSNGQIPSYIARDSELTNVSGQLQNKIDVLTFIDLTDTPAAYDIDKYLKSTVSGTEWATVSGAGGTSNHSELNELDYASSGHTGFAQTSHNHTESNITDLDKYTQAEVNTISGSLSSEIDSDITTFSGTIDHNTLLNYSANEHINWTNTGENLTTSGSITSGDLNISASNHLILPFHNDAVTPTLAFGDGDTGIYESADDTLHISIAGSPRYFFNAAAFNNNASLGAAIISETPSATNPVFAYSGDSDTGMGRAAADQLSLIAGGVEGIRITEDTTISVDIYGDLDITGNLTVSGTFQHTHIESDITDLNKYTQAEVNTISGSLSSEIDFDITTFSGTIDHDTILNYSANEHFTEASIDKYTQAEIDTISGSLQTNIDGKSDTGHGHTASDVSDWDEAVDDRVNNLLVEGDNISLIYDDGANTLTISGAAGGAGEANTASNLGAGEGVYYQKTGVDLEFKSLVAGNNISLSSDNDTITISGSAGGGASTLLELTDTPAAYDINKYLKSTTSGTVWATVSGGGTTDHSELTNIDYVSSGHTGFAQASHTHIESEITDLDKYTQSEIDTISGSLSAEIDSDIITFSGTIDHDTILNYSANEHFTEASIDKYTQSEIDTISGSLSAEIDSDITTFSGTIDHNTILNTHNLTTDIDHNALTNYVANEHIDWTNASDNLRTSATISGGSLTVSGGAIINGDLNISASNHLILPQHDDAATPTLAFGDGDTGFYETTDNTLYISIAESLRWMISTTYFGSAAGAGPALAYVSTTATVPGVLPYRGDSNTGIGLAAADQLSLIAGGVEGIRITEDTTISVDIYGDLDITGNLTVSGTFQHTHIESEITDLDKYTQAEIDTISGSLSAEIDSDISTHASSADHDGRYYTESEIDTISGSLQTNIDTKSDTGHGHIASDVSDWNEAVDDRVNNLLVEGDNISLIYDDGANTLTISGAAGSGEANTASNLGAGEGIYYQKTGVDLEFKSLVGGDNISLSSDNDTITISGSAGGGASTLLELTDTPAAYDINKYLQSTSSGTIWTTVTGGGGTTDHSALTNLDYASSGHTGFAQTSHTHIESEITDLDKYTQAEVDTISGSLSAEIDSDIITFSGTIDHDTILNYSANEHFTEASIDKYTQTEVDTISGSLSSEIDSDISTHASSADHDGRYYTESEIDTISGSLSSEIDSDISTHSASADHDGRYYTESEINTISGSLQTNIDAKFDTSVDNRMARYNSTNAVQGTGITISDNDDVVYPATSSLSCPEKIVIPLDEPTSLENGCIWIV